ncbi:hypothetical protein CPter91_4637 [Collimonas pratensis]|uniref:Uncharacterized protein n=1 Tax=Collimonas pratensis TaxID=279113 RepID=A0A127QAC0_9BURK|nr:hypothetical protein CPter91_4637 [Collimonas pratensis]
MVEVEEQSAVWSDQNCKVPEMVLYCIRCSAGSNTKLK